MSDGATIELERLEAGPRTGGDGPARVIVLNDDHNTFQGVAAALAHVLPGVDYGDGMQLADRIHHEGRAAVWSGQLEVAELYAEQLQGLGLSMAPVERG